ncbi:MAG: hypothetical protein FWH23_04035 [Bacteroidales bacterium]|nr:hypothetical protein [Bacteroidales bacterium]MCL2133686.1 hypothetical protein [Bacteroidales bacterium]
MINQQFQWYLDNQNELIRKYNGKYLVIKDCSVVSVYDTEKEAVFDSQEKQETGAYIIQFCSPGDAAYTQHFHSRVAFV